MQAIFVRPTVPDHAQHGTKDLTVGRLLIEVVYSADSAHGVPVLCSRNADVAPGETMPVPAAEITLCGSCSLRDGRLQDRREAIDEMAILQACKGYSRLLAARPCDLPSLAVALEFHPASPAPPVIYFTGQGYPEIFAVAQFVEISKQSPIDIA